MDRTNPEWIRIVKQAVRSGYEVYVDTKAYSVKQYQDNPDNFYILCNFNDSVIGLHGDLERGYGLNGEKFYIHTHKPVLLSDLIERRK
jgi:hypothetical protein